MLHLPELKEQILRSPGVLLSVVLFLGLLIGRNLLHPSVKKRPSKTAPAVPYWAPFGIDLFAIAINRIYSHDFFAWTRQILDVPGRTVSLNLLGIKLLMTDDTENTKQVLSTKFADFGKGEAFHKIWRDLMFDSIFATDGALWHDNKNLLRNHTAKSRPTDYAISERHVTVLIRNLSDGKPHDCLDQMDRFILDVVSDVFFGETAGTLSTELQPLRDAVEDMYIWNTQRILIGKLGALLPGTAKASAVLMRYLDRVIHQAVSVQDQQGEGELCRKRHTLLGSLISQGVSVKDSMMAILIGGKDPSSITLVWAFYELARNPQIVEKLRMEIEATVGFSELPTATQLKSMSLLQNIIKETLRLHVPLGFNIRTALRDTALPTGGGSLGKDSIDVPKGTHVVMSYIGIQRRHDLVGPTADTFDPFRWNDWTPKTWEFLPFNHGPRICLGRNFAWMQMEYLICRVFQQFASVELLGEDGHKVLGGEEMKIKIALNTKPAEPVLVRFARRKT
ncbi:MAG: hypothetical protein Q9173_004865 [Seirophora scorigena]